MPVLISVPGLLGVSSEARRNRASLLKMPVFLKRAFRVTSPHDWLLKTPIESLKRAYNPLPSIVMKAVDY